MQQLNDAARARLNRSIERNKNAPATPPRRDGEAPDVGGADELEQRRTRQRETNKSSQARIAELLRDGVPNDDDDEFGDELDAGDTGEGDESDGETLGDEQQAVSPGDLDSLAERLGVEVKDLWAIEFRDATGKQRTFGELKDLLAKNVDIDARELEFLERKAADENEILRKTQDLGFILERLGKHVTPELKERAKQERERIVRLENERTLKAIPEWRKSETMDKEKTAISAFIQQYGYGPSDLDRILDHRMLKLLRDSWQRYERVQSALAKVKEEKGGGKKPAPSSRNPAPRKIQRPAANAPDREKASAIGSLLREGIKRK